MADLFWIYILSGLIAGVAVSFLFSTFPGLISPSLKQIKPLSGFESGIFCALLLFMFLGIGVREMAWLDKTAYGTFFLLITVCAWTDIKKKIIPNRVVTAGAVSWLFLSIFYGFQGMEALAAAIALSFAMIVINLIYRWVSGSGAFGMGDIKLLFVIGLYTGWEGFWLLYLSVFTGALYAITGLTFQKIERKTRLAFAPFLTAGCTIGFFVLPWTYFWGWINVF